MSEGQTVYVLIIEHRHGTNVDVFASRQGALTALVGFVDDWWAREMPGKVIPSNDGDAISQYFEAVESEFYGIHECEVKP
jgi:hypothetical protein